jgi:hypothetical protein
MSDHRINGITNVDVRRATSTASRRETVSLGGIS